MYKVYGLKNNKTEKIFYIGLTKQKYVSKRKSQHIERAKEGKRKTKVYQMIRELNFKISYTVLEEFKGDQESAWEKEQNWINKLNPVGNTSPAKTIPPKMGGHNRKELPFEIIEQLGTMPDYKLAEKAGVSKRTILRKRQRFGVKSYAEQTGNDGKIKKGEPHRRWNIGN